MKKYKFLGFVVFAAVFFFGVSSAMAATWIAGNCLDNSAPVGGICNDLSTVIDLTAKQQSGNQNVDLAWGFETAPFPISATFDVQRDNVFKGNTVARVYTDLNVPAGFHTYQVRVNGRTGMDAFIHLGPWTDVMITVRLCQWSGFFQPVDMGVLNQVKAGSAIPMKFSLNGDMGLDIFAAGYPKSSVIACDPTAGVDAIEETVTAAGSSLNYDSIAGQYIYVWKTDKSWTGGCRQLAVKLSDGTIHYANFKFTK